MQTQPCLRLAETAAVKRGHRYHDKSTAQRSEQAKHQVTAPTFYISSPRNPSRLPASLHSSSKHAMWNVVTPRDPPPSPSNTYTIIYCKVAPVHAIRKQRSESLCRRSGHKPQPWCYYAVHCTCRKQCHARAVKFRQHPVLKPSTHTSLAKKIGHTPVCVRDTPHCSNISDSQLSQQALFAAALTSLKPWKCRQTLHLSCQPLPPWSCACNALGVNNAEAHHSAPHDSKPATWAHCAPRPALGARP